MKKALITGVAGFAGSHLAQYLVSKKFSVFGIFHPDHSIENVKHLKSSIKLIGCNLLDKNDLRNHIKNINPDYVFHLAAFSSPAESFKDPQKTLSNNIFSQLYLLESLVDFSPKARILIIGSADEYGDIDPKYLPAKEVTPLSPISPYAVSKVAQDMLGLQFFLHHKLQIVRVRPFNHIGPRQSASFVVSAFAAQIAEMESKGGQTIIVGDLSKVREFTDVRDMVKAYLLALEKCLPGEVYNIGTGIPVKIADLLEMLLSLARVRITVKVDKSRIPPVDIKMIYCDPSKFQKATSWKPRIPLLKTLSDTIEYERKKLR